MDTASSPVTPSATAAMSNLGKSATSSDSNNNSTTEDQMMQWVDYLPEQKPHATEKSLDKRGSMDPSGITDELTETNESMDMEDWPDSNSLEGLGMLPPALLLDHDPIIQQELLLEDNASQQDPSVAPEMFANSLEELLEQRRIQLMASMHASRRTRQFLEPHIRQRAGLAGVLTSIERSSLTVQEHFMHVTTTTSSTPIIEEATTTSEEARQSPPPGADHSDKDSVDMEGVVAEAMNSDNDDVEDFAASVLNDDADCML